MTPETRVAVGVFVATLIIGFPCMMWLLTTIFAPPEGGETDAR